MGHIKNNIFIFLVFLFTWGSRTLGMCNISLRRRLERKSFFPPLIGVNDAKQVRFQRGSLENSKSETEFKLSL